MILFNDKLARLILMSGYNSVTIGPIILTTKKRSEVNPCIIRHERIHVTQWFEVMLLGLLALLLLVELFCIPLWTITFAPLTFYVWYVVEYLIRRMACKLSHREAYRHIVFEQEAYEHQTDLEYIRKHRMLYDFIWYYHYKSINRKEV